MRRSSNTIPYPFAAPTITNISTLTTSIALLILSIVASPDLVVLMSPHRFVSTGFRLSPSLVLRYAASTLDSLSSHLVSSLPSFPRSLPTPIPNFYSHILSPSAPISGVHLCHPFPSLPSLSSLHRFSLSLPFQTCLLPCKHSALVLYSPWLAREFPRLAVSVRSLLHYHCFVSFSIFFLILYMVSSVVVITRVVCYGFLDCVCRWPA